MLKMQHISFPFQTILNIQMSIPLTYNCQVTTSSFLFYSAGTKPDMPQDLIAFLPCYTNVCNPTRTFMNISYYLKEMKARLNSTSHTVAMNTLFVLFQSVQLLEKVFVRKIVDCWLFFNVSLNIIFVPSRSRYFFSFVVSRISKAQ